MKFIKNHLAYIFILLFLLNLSISVSAQHNEYYPDPDPVIQQRLEDWQDLKFGLLMHWGAYSQWGIVESWSICPRRPKLGNRWQETGRSG
jgi:alpha-L-fucosidase